MEKGRDGDTKVIVTISFHKEMTVLLEGLVNRL